MLSKIITLICFQNTPLLLQHAHAVTVKNQNAHLSERHVYKEPVSQTPSQKTNTIMELVKKLSKNDKTITLLHLGIKANRKVRNSLNTFVN